MEDSRLLKKIVFRFAKKYIAGQTTSSALNTIRKYNQDKLKTTITMLNDHVDNVSKSKYNTNAYIHLIKQISRLHLNSDISIRPTQLGYGIGSSLAIANFKDVINAANASDIGIFIESEKNVGELQALSLYKDLKDQYPRLGVEIPVMTKMKHSEIKRLLGRNSNVKLVSRLYSYHAYELNGVKKKDDYLFQSRIAYIKLLLGLNANVTVSAFRSSGVLKLKSAVQKSFKRAIKFELPLGYSDRKLKKLASANIPMSVYAPYGADWIQYAINNFREGRIRNIALSILNDNKTTKSTKV